MGKRKLRELEEKYGPNKGCLNNKEDALRVQKLENKQRKLWKHIMSHARIGRVGA